MSDEIAYSQWGSKNKAWKIEFNKKKTEETAKEEQAAKLNSFL